MTLVFPHPSPKKMSLLFIHSKFDFFPTPPPLVKVYARKETKDLYLYLSPVSDRIDRHLHFDTIFDTQRLEPREVRRSGHVTYGTKSNPQKGENFVLRANILTHPQNEGLSVGMLFDVTSPT